MSARQLLYLSKGFGSYQAAKVPYIEMDSAKSAQTVLNNNNGKSSFWGKTLSLKFESRYE